jgi:S1-C subfamily serine protease
MVGSLRPGDSVVFTVIRDGANRDFTVRIEPRTDEVAADSKNLWPGLTVVPLTDAVRSSLRLDNNAQGLYVSSVIAETPAAIIGLQRGDRITHINDTPVRDLVSFYRVLRDNTSRELWFTFIRGETTLDSLRFRR